MTRLIQDILDHADKLAQGLEGHDHKSGDGRLGEEVLLERAVIARARSESQIIEAITAARAKAVSWDRIGELLGTSSLDAQKRYAAIIKPSWTTRR